MKISYVQMSAQCHIDVHWDADKKHFVLKVATNDLPTIPCSLESTKSMAEYFEQLRTRMKPLTLEDAGKTFSYESLDDLLNKVTLLQKRGFRIPETFEKDLKNKHQQSVDLDEQSWASRKEASQEKKQPSSKQKKSAKP